jgi:hypothetical protein
VTKSGPNLRAALVALATAGLLALPADAQTSNLTSPSSGLTKAEVETVFAAAIFDCLRTRMDGQSIRDLPASDRADLRPASADDRIWAQNPSPETPVWVTEKLGYLLSIAEPAPERCEVRAIQLPVEDTFRVVRFAMSKAFPDFKPVTLRPGYDPIAYQLEMVDHDTRYVLHLEGAEPGAPMHAFRFSLLYALFLRQPASQPPAFRSGQ